MFQQLLEDVRGLVISRAFAARPRRVEITPIETVESAAAPSSAAQVQVSGIQAGSIQPGGILPGGSKKKRKRH